MVETQDPMAMHIRNESVSTNWHKVIQMPYNSIYWRSLRYWRSKTVELKSYKSYPCNCHWRHQKDVDLWICDVVCVIFDKMWQIRNVPIDAWYIEFHLEWSNKRVFPSIELFPRGCNKNLAWDETSKLPRGRLPIRRILLVVPNVSWLLRSIDSLEHPWFEWQSVFPNIHVCGDRSISKQRLVQRQRQKCPRLIPMVWVFGCCCFLHTNTTIPQIELCRMLLELWSKPMELSKEEATRDIRDMVIEKKKGLLLLLLLLLLS